MIKPNPNWRGDPTFLPEVLKAFGVEVVEFPGWRDRGHGDFGAIQGIIVHHIGSDSYPARGIAQHPQLGLCSQIHLSRKGVATLCGVGIAWHAGRGDWYGWPTNNANQVSIGIEPESNGTSPWPEEQLDAYYRVCAAILWFLGKKATQQTLLGHKEYSGRAQGKWDPGGIDMNHFRARVNWYIDNPPFGGKKEIAKKLMTAFDEINRKYTSRVAGSNFEMRPIDALLNADAHAFTARANTEVIIKNQNKTNKLLEDTVALLKDFVKDGE